MGPVSGKRKNTIYWTAVRVYHWAFNIAQFSPRASWAPVRGAENLAERCDTPLELAFASVFILICWNAYCKLITLECTLMVI